MPKTATLKEIWFVAASGQTRQHIKAQQRVTDITPQNAGYYGVLGNYSTNVVLTGDKATDLRRIMRAKVNYAR